MSSSIPQVPPRPTRTTQQEQIPTIPPRPARKVERSVSPHRYARSPLNAAPTNNHGVYGAPGNISKSSLHLDSSSALDLPPRPPSVNLPSLGQEGSEYGEVFTPELKPTHVSDELQIHAPKASLPVASAKKRLSTVTRTDSDSAAAHGIGKPRSERGDDLDASSRSLRSKTSQASIGKERRPSSAHGDHGIPEIGQQVPMYPHAGDVQAPSPAPTQSFYPPGIGFHNDGSKPRHHNRRQSGRDTLPADAYGRFGHNIVHEKDQFERAYAEKHPEIAAREVGHYGEGRGEWAMSNDDLNRLVRETASRSSGMGTKSSAFSIPSEEVGHQATEEYASRISSPRPQSGYATAHGNKSATHVDSPLQRSSFPTDGAYKEEIEGVIGKKLGGAFEHVAGSETEDDDVIHVDHPGYKLSKVYSSSSRHDSQTDLGHHQEEEATPEDHGYTAPILADDEVAKEPFGYDLQPAVSPLHQRGYYDDSGRYHRRTGSGSMSGSRPSSRPGSIHGGIPGLRVSDATHLEDLQEYEPLFPEEEKNANQQKPLSQADRLKQRPDLKSRKFPSQDVWEDTPSSLQYTAEVSTPQDDELTEGAKAQAKAEVERNETPGQAFARRQEELAERESQNPDSFLHREQKTKASWPQNAPSSADDRSISKQRFPSRDIWEDTPDSLQLQTTVAAPQAEEDVLSPPDERPTTGALVFHQEKHAAGEDLSPDEGRATTGIAATMKPDVPTRPVRLQGPGSPEKTHPLLPERPARSKAADANAPPVPVKTKPAVPVRPAKRQESGDGAPLTTVESNTSTKSTGSEHSAAAASKPKPPVPARPLGGKIAALQGGFLSDLNKRLQLGPQAPKKEEPAAEEPETVQEKAPLSDARKGRARGPARRAPAKSPAPAAETEKSAVSFSISSPSSIWQIDPEQDNLHVFSSTLEVSKPQEIESGEPVVKTLGTNTAGETIKQTPRGSATAEDTSKPVEVSKESTIENREDASKAALAARLDNQALAPLKTSNTPPINVKDDTPPMSALRDYDSTDRLTVDSILSKSKPESQLNTSVPEEEKEVVDIEEENQSKPLLESVTEKLQPLANLIKSPTSAAKEAEESEEKSTLPGAFDKEEEVAASTGASKVSESETL